MIYITGDTHGNFLRYVVFAREKNLTEEDVMIVLGDAGLNYTGDERDRRRKEYVSSFPFTTFCIHGNHEMRPTDVPTYKMREYRGGTVWYEEDFPNILFAKDGEVYDFDGHSCLVIGGAYSVDKFHRLAYGWQWFPNEQPSQEIKDHVEQQLLHHNNKVDVVLSHTCPIQYEPTEVFIKGIDQGLVDKSTEKWLGQIEEKLDYKRWYCGHYHTEKKVDRMRFLYESVEEFMGEVKAG